METLDTAGIRPKIFYRIIPALVVLTWLAMPTLASRTARTRPRPVRQSKPVRTVQTPSGGSPSFRQSLVVPTLDSSWPRGKNIIWCSSFQLAWNEIRDDVIGAPLQVGGATELAAQLNAAEQSSSDLDPNSFYVSGGRIEDGIIDRIKKDMKVRFPSHVLADFKDYAEGILAYSYLAANVPFTHPFRQSENGLAFRDSRGSKTQVEAFGLWEAYRREHAPVRDQVEILYEDKTSGGYPRAPVEEFAIDLCRGALAGVDWRDCSWSKMGRASPHDLQNIVDIYGTYGLRQASTIQRRPGCGGGCQRELSTASCTSPTKRVGILRFHLGRVSHLKCPV